MISVPSQKLGVTSNTSFVFGRKMNAFCSDSSRPINHNAELMSAAAEATTADVTIDLK